MLPTLKPGQEVITFNWAYLFFKPKVGDIIVFKKAGKLMVKRIHTLNDRLIYVQGDNKEDSTDSRKFGWLSSKDILGKVIYIHQKHLF